MASAPYTISDLAAEFALTPRAIRHYEEMGLLHPGRRGTVRLFTEGDRKRLRLVLRGRRLGFTLEEIKEMLDLHYAGEGAIANAGHLLNRIAEHRRTLAQLQEDVGMALGWLDHLEARCKEPRRRSA
jgi:DNA-binding transcriptional MerR regulator